MKIAIVGTGIVGRTIATKLASLGHQVTIGTRDVSATLSNSEKDGYGNPPFSEWKSNNTVIELKTFNAAASDAELLFNCTGGQVSIAALAQIDPKFLAGKTLIDVANPLDFSQGMPPSLNPVNTDSLGEQIQKRFPDLNVVKALNTLTASIMVAPETLKGDHNIFVCGNSEKAKSEAKSLLNEFGWSDASMIDLGDISNARGTEMLLPIWLRLWASLGTAEFNFHIQRN